MSAPRPVRSNKVCIACGETMFAGDYTDSIKTWRKRKFCTQTCRFDFNAGRTPTTMPAHSPLVVAEVGACRAHLRALVIAGLRQGYLYSLPANDLQRLATEFRVAA